VRDRPDVAVVTVSTDDGPEDVKTTLQTVLRDAPPFQVLFDSDQSVSRGKYGSRLVPETWFIDKNGIIRARFDGARDWTNPLFVNFVDALRAGDYCPVKIDAKNLAGKAGRICEEMSGG
jgi:hypothetical protein